MFKKPIPDSSILAGLQIPIFRALWIATIFSNLGTLMKQVGAVWLMTTLTDSTFLVGLVQTATGLPFLMVGLLAGAVADLFDRRILMIVTQIAMTVVNGILTVTTWMGHMTPELLLGINFLLGTIAAFNGTAWMTMLSDMVGPKLLPSAVSLNSISFNTARSIGPAIGGIVVAAYGPATTFLLNTLSFAVMIHTLLRWHPVRPVKRTLSEDVFGAMQSGVRYLLHAERIHAPLIRAAAFSFGVGAIWSLFPLYVRDILHSNAAVYGYLLGGFGLGAFVGAASVPKTRATFSPEQIAHVTTLLSAAGLALFALFVNFYTALIGTFVIGFSWITLFNNLNVLIQTGVPTWVRGRTMSFYMFIIQGGNAMAGIAWGWAAGAIGIAWSFGLAGLLILVSVLISLRYQLESTEKLDLSPAISWPEPLLLFKADTSHSAVLVTIEYRINTKDIDTFRAIMEQLRGSRLRDGARTWQLYRDADNPNRLIEVYQVDSWQEHLRQRDRSTKEDQFLESKALALHKGTDPPKMDHWIGTE